MAVIRSSHVPGTKNAIANRKAQLELLETVAGVAEVNANGGSDASRKRHLARGKMLPRERIAGLIDPASPFLEIGATAAWGVYDENVPAAGLIAGVGRVHGHDVMVVCNDPTVKGGTYYPLRLALQPARSPPNHDPALCP